MTAIADALWRLAYRVAYRLMRVWWWIRRPAQNSAYVAVWRGDDLLLIRNSYRSGVTIPCGDIGRRETPRQAARRELEEEVGIRVGADDLEFVCDLNLDFENKDDHAYFFELHRGAEAPIEIAIDRREVIWAEFCPLNSLYFVALTPHVLMYLSRRDP
jgi:8-oxo-dGTP diphosphatase